MSMTEPEWKRAKTYMPGMSHTIQAGDELVISDQEGQEMSVKATESDAVLAFFIAFDNWMTAKRGGILGTVLAGLWMEVELRFDSLPDRIKMHFPSVKSRVIHAR